jgi:hypothetical protein
MRNIFLCSHACCFLALVGLICLLWVNCFTQGETVFMSPPWGGPDYAKVDVYDIKTMLKPCDGYSLFKLGTSIASRVVMFLPRNIDQNQLADMCLSVDPPWAVEVEKNFLNGKLKAITAYFEQQDGSDVQDASDTNPQNPEYHA